MKLGGTRVDGRSMKLEVNSMAVMAVALSDGWFLTSGMETARRGDRESLPAFFVGNGSRFVG